MTSGLNMIHLVTLLSHLSVFLAHSAPATPAALPALENCTHLRALALAVPFQERRSSIFLHGLLPALLLRSDVTFPVGPFLRLRSLQAEAETEIGVQDIY